MPLGGKLAVTEVALVVTVSEPGRNFPQVSPPDRLTAERTEGLRTRCPVIDQNELHAAILNVRKRVSLASSGPIQLVDQSIGDGRPGRPKQRRRAFHAISGPGRACSATRADRNRTSLVSVCARYPDRLLIGQR